MADETPESDPLLPGGRLAWIGGAVALGLAVAIALYWFVVPRVADGLVRDRLAGLESRAGVIADYERIETSATEGVKLHGIELRRTEADEPFATVGAARARLSLYHLLFASPVISSIDVRRARLRIHRDDQGLTNLERILRRLANGGEGGERTSTPSNGGSPGLLRYFGGSWPDADVVDARIRFTSAEGAADWPIRSISTPETRVDAAGQSAEITGTVEIARGPGADPRWHLPERVELEGTLRLPLKRSTGTIRFDESLQVVGLGPLPFVRTGLSELRLGRDATVELRGVSLAMQADGEPRSLGAADRLLVSFSSWPTSLADLQVDRVVLERPKVVAHVDRQHGSAVNDLIQLTRAPVARRVAGRAATVARRTYLDIPRWRRPDLDGDGEPGRSDDDAEADGERRANEKNGASEKEEAKPTITDRLKNVVTSDLVTRLTPNEARIDEAQVHMTDQRRLGLDRHAETLGLRSGSLVFEHDADSGDVRLEGGFDAYAGESDPRGTVSVEVGGNYRQGTVEGSARIDELDLSWVSQIVGASLARRVRGGTLDAKFESQRNVEADRHEFHGHVELQRAHLAVEHLAEKPIDEMTAGYAFKGYYAPSGDIPKPKHIEWKHLSPDDRLDQHAKSAEAAPAKKERAPDALSFDGPPEDAAYPTRGAVVFTKGRASLNGVEAEVRPALYGLDGLRSLPARFDTTISLEETPLQTLFDAVPKSIRGPLADASLQGSFAWDFDVEVPLYNAGEMEWSVEPRLRTFKLKSLPSKVDIREIERAFSLKIQDPSGEFSRRVDIPEMRPVSARFLTDHCELEIAELDERRRRRGWPPLPTIAELGPTSPSGVRSTPRVWLTEAAESMTAPKPWSSGQPLATIDRSAIPASQSAVEYARAEIERQRRSRNATEPDDTGPTSRKSGGPEPGSGGAATRAETETTTSGPFNFGPFGGSTSPPSKPKRPEPRPLDESIIVTHEGETRVHPYGPYVYVPLHHMSKWLPRAVMTTEDNSFFEHDGFNWFALEESVEDNIGAGGFVRGGSTISMQLVKNLYLSFDKVLARKLREAFLVWIMEEVVDVPKARILELYFNVIEFGPGIFGIHDASVHYFGKRPDQLTLSEVLFLISIVPNPKEYHRYYERGSISDSWYESIITYAEIMQSRDRATAEDVSRVKNNRPTFYKPAPGEPQLRPSARNPEPSTSEGSNIDDFSKIFQ